VVTLAPFEAFLPAASRTRVSAESYCHVPSCKNIGATSAFLNGNACRQLSYNIPDKQSASTPRLQKNPRGGFLGSTPSWCSIQRGEQLRANVRIQGQTTLLDMENILVTPAKPSLTPLIRLGGLQAWLSYSLRTARRLRGTICC
jgi:hypothetical protein